MSRDKLYKKKGLIVGIFNIPLYNSIHANRCRETGIIRDCR